MKSTTFLNLALAGLAAAAPAANKHHEDHCDNSWASFFDLSEIIYSSSIVYSTPAHMATHSGNIDFNLTNPAIPYTTHCSAVGMHLYDMFYGEFTYTCTPPEGATGVTNFTYSRPSNAFSINQTWTDGGKQFIAQGNGSVDLQCQDSTYQNPDWELGQIYSTQNVECQPAQLRIDTNVEMQW